MISIKEVPHNPPPHTISGVKFKKNSDFFMIQDLDDLCIFIFNDKQQLPYSIVEGSFFFSCSYVPTIGDILHGDGCGHHLLQYALLHVCRISHDCDRKLANHELLLVNNFSGSFCALLWKPIHEIMRTSHRIDLICAQTEPAVVISIKSDGFVCLELGKLSSIQGNLFATRLA